MHTGQFPIGLYARYGPQDIRNQAPSREGTCHALSDGRMLPHARIHPVHRHVLQRPGLHLALPRCIGPLLLGPALGQYRIAVGGITVSQQRGILPVPITARRLCGIPSQRVMAPRQHGNLPKRIMATRQAGRRRTSHHAVLPVQCRIAGNPPAWPAPGSQRRWRLPANWMFRRHGLLLRPMFASSPLNHGHLTRPCRCHQRSHPALHPPGKATCRRWLRIHDGLIDDIRCFAVGGIRPALVPPGHTGQLLPCAIIPAPTRDACHRSGRQPQQMTGRAVLQPVQWRHAHPGGMTGPRQRHIQFAQILAQTLLIRLLPNARRQLATAAQGQLQIALRIVPRQKCRLSARCLRIHLPGRTGIGQKDQWIFQPLRLVHGHHAHPGIIALQPLSAGIHLSLGLPALFAQIADQRMLALQLAGCGLQQLAQMQQIRQLALLVPRQQLLDHPEILQHPPDHRQHALPTPDVAILHESRHLRLPVQLVLRQPQQALRIQPAQRGAQRRAHGPGIPRFRTGLQPEKQLAHHRRGKDRFTVRQIHAANTLRPQCATDGPGLLPVIDQDGHVRRLHRTAMRWITLFCIVAPCIAMP